MEIRLDIFIQCHGNNIKSEKSLSQIARGGSENGRNHCSANYQLECLANRIQPVWDTGKSRILRDHSYNLFLVDYEMCMTQTHSFHYVQLLLYIGTTTLQGLSQQGV